MSKWVNATPQHKTKFEVSDRDWHEMVEFVYQFNAYNYWGSHAAAFEAASSLENDPNNVILLRTAMFCDLRSMHHMGDRPNQRSWNRLQAQRAIIEGSV